VDTEKTGGLRNIAVTVPQNSLDVLPLDPPQCGYSRLMNTLLQRNHVALDFFVDSHDLIRICWLRKKIIGTQAHRRQCGRNTSIASKHDDGSCVRYLA